MQSEHQPDKPSSPTTEELANGHHSGEILQLDKHRRVELLKESRNGLITRLTGVVAQALGQLSEELTSLATKKTDADEQREMHDAASLVGAHKSQVETKFQEHFSQLFEQRLFNTVVSTDPDHELALVDDSYIRDKLKRGRLVDKTSAKLESEEVLGIRARLAALIERDWFEENDHPACPVLIYEALQKSIDAVGDDPQVRFALLNAFEPYITANLNTIYARINTYLRERDVLPRIKPGVTVAPDTGRTGTKPGEPGDPSDTLGRAAGAGDEETIVLPPPGEARDKILEALAGEVAEGVANARSSAVRVLSEPKNFADDAEAPDPDSDLIATLDSLQNDIGDVMSPGQGALQALGDQARGAGSPLDQLTVEIVSLIFDFLYDDPRIPDPVKNQLLRLQVVAVKAALLDRSFFASRQHPMRQLIDRTTDLSCDPDTNAGEGSDFVKGLHELVNWVLAEFDRDLTVFAEAVERLAELEKSESDRREQDLSELTENAQQSESLTMAHEEAMDALSRRMDDMTPAFVREFMLDYWSEVLVALRVGEQADATHWEQHLKLAEKLIWSVLPKSPKEINLMAPMLPKVIGGINKGLTLGKSQHVSHDSFFNELMKWHTRIVASAKRKEAELANAAAAMQMQADGSVQFQQPEQDLDDSETLVAEHSPVDELIKGQQVELREQDAEPMRVKLAWISPAKKLFALSRFPDFARSYKRAEIIAMLESGQLVRVHAEPTLDRVIQAVGASDEPQQGAGGPVSDPAADKAAELQKAFSESVSDSPLR